MLNPTKTVDELITALSYIIDIKGRRNTYHAWRIAVLSAKIAKNRQDAKRRKEIFYAGLLCDISGVEFPRHITYYLKRVDPVSRNLLLSHPIISAQLISDIPNMASCAKLILDHHEWVNGAGYPRAKTKKYIPLGSQLIRIADAIDLALQTNPIVSLKQLKKRLSLNIDKEYSKNIFRSALDILKKDSLFNKIKRANNIPVIFHALKERIGPIHIPSKVDAVGTSLAVAAQIIDTKHPYTSGHSQRVSRYALACALAMKLNHDEVTGIKWAGLIHDIGKLNVARRILDKPGHLTRKEFQEVKRHPLLTQKIMEMIPSLKDIALMAASHHERFDGSGYPFGLKDQEIPLGARILGVCDAFDAMTSSRPYRKPLPPEAACQEIEKESGRQFDLEITKHALPIFRSLCL